jgi:hypothetical protein
MTAEEAKDGRRVSGHRILPKPTSGLELIGTLHKIGRAAQRREDQKSFWPYDIDWFQAKID